MKEVCSIYNSPIGQFTIANDGYYVTNILYGNYSNEFQLEQQNSINAKVMEELNEYFDGKRQTFDIPIDFHGTNFQNKVWRAILKIPYGKTRSYSEIAEDIGKPNAVRAIGSANAKNPIAILIPSHRVVTSNGTLAGYNGGIFNKKKLLDLEKSTINEMNQKLITENKISSELLKMALSSTDICEFYYYPQVRVCIIPEKTCKSFNLKPKYECVLEEFANQKIFIDDRKIFIESFKRICKGETPIKFEARFIDGITWNRCTLSIAQYDENNNPLIIVGIVENITKQKNLEMEKDKLNTLNTEILSSLSQLFLGVHKLNLTTGKIYSIKLVNGVSQFELNSKYNFDDWIDNFSKQYYHIDDRKKLISTFSLENIIKNRNLGVKLMEEKYRRILDGSYHWISNNIILNNENFSRDTAIIFQMDVSQSYKNIEISQVLCNDYYALYYIDIDNNIYEPIHYDNIVKNRINIQKRGNYQDITEKYINTFVHESEKSSVLEFMSLDNLRISLNRQNKEISKVFRKKISLHYEWVEMRFTLINDDNKRMAILSIKNVNNDIREELETKQLLEFAFTHTRNLSMAKSDFLSKMSQNIKQPITSISGYTTLAKNNVDNPEKMLEYLEKISYFNNELLKLINTTLDLSKLENGTYNIDNKEFSLSNFIQYILEIEIPDIEKKNIIFNYYIENINHEILISDIEKISLTLMNILSNAIKYTHDGGKVDFTIRELSTSNDDKVHYQFIVKDTGIGIPNDEIDEIFHSFSRGSNVGNIPGTGLGLTTVASMVKLLKGQINMESEVNKGTTVTVDLSFDTNEKNIPYTNDFSKIKALVVNGNRNELKYICSILQELNIDTTPMYLGKYAVDTLLLAKSKSKDYSIVIIDEKLQDIDYLTLIKDIYKNIGTEPIKIIVTTFNIELTKVNCQNLNVDAIMPKPLFKINLIETLSNLTEVFKKCYYKNPIKTKILKGYNCLLVEHNKTTQPIAVELVSLLGANVTLAKNDIEAIEIFRDNMDKFDFITMNIDVPNSEKYKSTKYIRTLNKDIPIIALGSSTFPEDIKNAIKNGCTSHISKPIDNHLSLFVYIILSSIQRYKHKLKSLR
ncbi:MAG: methylated-DNA--[protein]-cysteine S-methyltransferase [Oscillospiraceae bacterium]